jgi:Serine carboxypeptidase
MTMQYSLILISNAFCAFTVAQFPPTPENVTVIRSRFDDAITISYKEVCVHALAIPAHLYVPDVHLFQPGFCETTPGVRSYAGYVTLPPGTVTEINQNFSISTFFWFFESRKDPSNAPLSIWMNGGPGSSSMVGLLTEHGPCMVNSDSNSTTLNPWSWNNEVNMLYIDQPVQTGFSYDALYNGTYDATTQAITLADFTDGTIPQQNNTLYVGTFPSTDNSSTTNGTQNSARAIWHFAQEWFQEFPAYKPNDDRISIWSQSYGGHYGPSFTAYFQQQNEKIANRSITTDGETYYINLDTLGIISGCIDLLTQELSYPEMAYNNTYGIQVINETAYQQAITDWSKAGGCRDLILRCRALASEGDPMAFGNNDTVNAACVEADQYCSIQVEGPFFNGDRGYYDIAHINPDPFPPPYYGYVK